MQQYNKGSVSILLDIVTMVQLFYYENRGKNVRKLLSYEGAPFRVNLYPSEDIGSTATCYWVVRLPWWNHSKAQIVEVCGTHYRYATAKLRDQGEGNFVLKGHYKDSDHKHKFRQLIEYVHSSTKKDLSDSKSIAAKSSSLKRASYVPDFKDFRLILSTNVSNEDFQQGYSMTGRLEKGFHSTPYQSTPRHSPLPSTHPSESTTQCSDSMSVTHIAVVKRKGY
ncbi:hypothetical protein EB796_012434 [Bugula neritina]|uniref:Uncharacterized protein n=1 Tax=Bugula neritina TaxID=10212 RepID=A0A7J7JUC4_BUGNE|nr:hypothetical protein EB796_012434 [Bugula neritina]